VIYSESSDSDESSPVSKPSRDSVATAALVSAVPRVKQSNASALLSRNSEQSVPRISKSASQPLEATSLFQKLKVQDRAHKEVKGADAPPIKHIQSPQEHLDVNGDVASQPALAQQLLVLLSTSPSHHTDTVVSTHKLSRLTPASRSLSLQDAVEPDDAVADEDHEAMVTAAREHYVDDCENEHGIPLIPAVRSAILDGTPVAVSDVRRLSLNQDSSPPAVLLRKAPSPSISSSNSFIPSRRGSERVCIIRAPMPHTNLQLHEDADGWALQDVDPIFLHRRTRHFGCIYQRT
jgi:hypothetical protein